MGECREDRGKLLSEVHSGRTRGNKDKLGHGKSQLRRGIFFPHENVQTLK